MNGDTPLLVAVYGRDVWMIEYLIDSGANPKIRDVGGNTPLDVAIAFHKVEIREYLNELNQKEGFYGRSFVGKNKIKKNQKQNK